MATPHSLPNDSPLIDQKLAEQLVDALGLLVELSGRGSAAGVVLQQARTEIASLAISASRQAANTQTSKRRAA